MLELKAEVGQRKQVLTIFAMTLVFLLALFNQLDEIVSRCILGIFGVAVGGNVGAKVANALPNIFKKSETSE